jgi:hypothetical protein
VNAPVRLAAPADRAKPDRIEISKMGVAAGQIGPGERAPEGLGARAPEKPANGPRAAANVPEKAQQPRYTH